MNQKLKEVGVLQEKYKIPESLYDGPFSKTAQFMLPAIGINITHKLIFKYFINAFLGDKEHKHNYSRPIFLLFGVKDYRDLDWKKVYLTLTTRSKNYITEYDVGIKDDKYLIMLVFNVPEEYEQDYLNFRVGKYSLFSSKYKEKFPKYMDSKREKKNIHWQIINKDEDLKNRVIDTFNTSHNLFGKDDEIWEMPRKEREFYRYKKESI